MKALFEEKQKFTQWWLWLIVGSATLVVLVIFLEGVYKQLIVGEPWGEHPLSDDALITLSILAVTAMVLTLIAFFNTVLEIVVDRGSIKYRYFPLIRQWKRIEREEIQNFEARTFYLSGYGVKRDLRGNRSITIKGHRAVALTMQNGKTLMLGTQQPEEFLSALRKMKNSRVE